MMPQESCRHAATYATDSRLRIRLHTPLILLQEYTALPYVLAPRDDSWLRHYAMIQRHIKEGHYWLPHTFVTSCYAGTMIHTLL